MADGAALWNRRRHLCDFTAFERIPIRRQIEEELVAETVRAMSTLEMNFVNPCLWAQVTTLQAVLYKQHNQHRKEKYYQGLQRVQKSLKRLQDMEIHNSLQHVIQQFPRVEDRDPTATGPSCFPHIEIISHLLGCMMGCAKLADHTVKMCEETVKHVLGQLAHGFFVTFHVVSVASLSRIWVLLKNLLQDTVDCYNITRPWLERLREPTKGKIDGATFPECLESWLAMEKPTKAVKPAAIQGSLQKYSTPVKLKSSSFLEKLFASTPGLSPQARNLNDAIDRGPLIEANPQTMLPVDHGELVAPREIWPVDQIKMASEQTEEIPETIRHRIDPLKSDCQTHFPRRTRELFCLKTPAKKKHDSLGVRKDGSDGKLQKTKSRMSTRTFPVFRTSCSPTIRMKERCRKLLFRRRNSARSASFQCGIQSKNLSDADSSSRHDEKVWSRNFLSQAVDSGNTSRNGKEKVDRTTVVDGCRDVRQSTPSNLKGVMDCPVIRDLEQGQRLVSLPSEKDPVKARAMHNRAGNAQQTAKKGDIDDIFRLLDL